MLHMIESTKIVYLFTLLDTTICISHKYIILDLSIIYLPHILT